MMKQLAIALFLGALLLAGTATAAGTTVDKTALQTRQGPVALHPVHHASFVMHWNGQTVYVDPVGPIERYRGLGTPDVILITHAHGDHLSPKTLAKLDTSQAVVVMPASVAEKIGDRFGQSQKVLNNGENLDTHGMTIRAVPMYNMPPSPDSRHPKGWGNGYLLTLGGKRVYISGDTGGTPEMRSLQHIDMAFVCMNLPYTMSAADAADAVLAFKPAVVYPYHYRGQDVHAFKRRVEAKDSDIEVRLRNWYAE